MMYSEINVDFMPANTTFHFGSPWTGGVEFRTRFYYLEDILLRSKVNKDSDFKMIQEENGKTF